MVSRPGRLTGGSVVPDKLFQLLIHVDDYLKVCMKNNLKYAYGKLGDKREKLLADMDFAHVR